MNSAATICPRAPQRVIVIPDGRRVSLSAYVKAWSHVKSLPPDQEVRGWDLFPTRAGVILGQMRRGIDDRINEKDPTFNAGDADEEAALRRLARMINGSRVVIRPGDVPPRYRRELSHRILDPRDD